MEMPVSLRVLRVFVAAVVFQSALFAQDWPQILGPNRNGIYTGPEIVPSFPRTGPPQLWIRNVGAGFSGPAVVGDRLILFHRIDNRPSTSLGTTVSPSNGRETVEAMDASTGKTIWSFDYATSYRDDFGFDEGPRAVPVIAGGRVFTHGADGWLHGIDFATGKMLWSITRESGELALAPASPKAFRFAARAQLVKGVVRAFPALANGRYYVRNERQLAAYDLNRR